MIKDLREHRRLLAPLKAQSRKPEGRLMERSFRILFLCNVLGLVIHLALCLSAVGGYVNAVCVSMFAATAGYWLHKQGRTDNFPVPEIQDFEGRNFTPHCWMQGGAA